MFGPQFTLRKKKKFVPFGRFLLGAIRLGGVIGESSSQLDQTTWNYPPNTDFGLAFGGGLDIQLHDKIALRPFAGVAQLVERNLTKVEVESSRLFSRSNYSKGMRDDSDDVPPELKRFPFFPS